MLLSVKKDYFIHSLLFFCYFAELSGFGCNTVAAHMTTEQSKKMRYITNKDSTKFQDKDWETYKKHEEYASEKNPSIHRRCIGHDYGSRCIYLITMTTEERKPLFGQLRGDADVPEGASDAPYIELSELGKAVKSC